MPRKCTVPNCNSNYDSQEKYVSTFSFPKCDEMKAKWISALRIVDFCPTKNSAICIKHFKDEDVINHHKVDGKTLDESLIQRRLKPSAVPSIFTHFSKHYLPKTVQKRTDPVDRASKVIIAHEQNIEDFLQKDRIKDFKEFSSECLKFIDEINWRLVSYENSVYVYSLRCGEFNQIGRCIYKCEQ